MRASEIGSLAVTTNILYSMEKSKDSENDEYRQMANFSVEVVDPFEHAVRYMSMKVIRRMLHGTMLCYLTFV